MFDNDSIPEGNADNQDISETESEEGPDLSVLDLYLKLFNLFNCLSLQLMNSDPKENDSTYCIRSTVYCTRCFSRDTYGNLKTLSSP